MREWLPQLVGIESQLGVSIDGEVVASVPEAEHAAALTRETVTPAVHYLRFGFTEAQVADFAGADDVALVATHPAYEATDHLAAGGPPGAARRTSSAQQRPLHRLTRDNSVRNSLQTHRTCAILFVRRIWGCRSRSLDQKGPRTGRIKYPPFLSVMRKCFP